MDITVSQLDAALPLNAFNFDILFNGTFLTADSVVSGGFLPAPSLVLLQTINASSVSFAEASLTSSGTAVDGVLASLTFLADVVSVSQLSFSALSAFSAPFGQPIVPESLNVAEIVVQRRGGKPVPESATGMWLLGIAVVSLRFSRRFIS